MRPKTRSVHIAEVTTAPNGAYTKQVARNLTESRGREACPMPGASPELKCIRGAVCAFNKRGMPGSHDSFGEASFRRTLREYVTHFRSERDHQGVENRLLESCATGNATDGSIHCRERLCGMLNFYYHEAA